MMTWHWLCVRVRQDVIADVCIPAVLCHPFANVERLGPLSFSFLTTALRIQILDFWVCTFPREEKVALSEV